MTLNELAWFKQSFHCAKFNERTNKITSIQVTCLNNVYMPHPDKTNKKMGTYNKSFLIKLADL